QGVVVPSRGRGVVAIGDGVAVGRAHDLQLQGVPCGVDLGGGGGVVQLAALAAKAGKGALVAGACRHIVAHGLGHVGVDVQVVTGHQAEGDLVVGGHAVDGGGGRQLEGGAGRDRKSTRL